MSSGCLIVKIKKDNLVEVGDSEVLRLITFLNLPNCLETLFNLNL